jgi:hypothetical protein
MTSLIAADAGIIGIAVFFVAVIALVCAIYAVHVRLLARRVRQSKGLRRRAARVDLREDAPSTVDLHPRPKASKRRAHHAAVRTGVLSAQRKGDGS